LFSEKDRIASTVPGWMLKIIWNFFQKNLFIIMKQPSYLLLIRFVNSNNKCPIYSAFEQYSYCLPSWIFIKGSHSRIPMIDQTFWVWWFVSKSLVFCLCPGILVVNDVRSQALQAVYFWHSCFHSISDAMQGSRISKRGLQKDRSVSAGLCLFSTNTIFLSGFQVCFSKTYENSHRYEIFHHERDIFWKFCRVFSRFSFLKYL